MNTLLATLEGWTSARLAAQGWTGGAESFTGKQQKNAIEAPMHEFTFPTSTTDSDASEAFATLPRAACVLPPTEHVIHKEQTIDNDDANFELKAVST